MAPRYTHRSEAAQLSGTLLSDEASQFPDLPEQLPVTLLEIVIKV